MREIHVPYGTGDVAVRIDDRNLLQVIEPNRVEIRDPADVLRDALAGPYNSGTFAEFVSGDESILVIVNDASRPTPTATVLDSLSGDLRHGKTEFIVATGAHRAPTGEELRQIFGRHYDRYRDHIHVHDARNDEEMVYLGTSRSGTEMSINRRCVEAGRILVIGSVEPHYFAGFTGGRKAFLPGTAAYKTIEQNHRNAMDPDARVLVLDGNPVHEDMVDALGSMGEKEIFAVMMVLDGDRNIYAAAAGHLHDSFHAAIDSAKEVFVVPAEGPADIVVTVAAYPMDIDLYQSQKAIENGKCILKDGGILILVSQCRTGVGDDTFVRLLSSSDTPGAVFEAIRQEYKLGYHKAAKMAELSLRSEIRAVTGLPDGVLRSISIEPYHDIQHAVDDAVCVKGENAQVVFLMDGSMTVPQVAPGGSAGRQDN